MYSNDTVIDMLEYIDQNVNRQITIDELSSVFFYNRYSIMKLFKKEMHITIIDYINKKRIYDSLKEVGNTNLSFTRISINHGFYAMDYFSRIFKNIMGISPLLYRKYKKKVLSKQTYYNILTKEIELQELMNNIKTYKNNKKPRVNMYKTIFKFK